MLRLQLLVYRLLIYPRTTALAQTVFRYLTKKGAVVGSSSTSEFEPVKADDFFKGISIVQARSGLRQLQKIEPNTTHRIKMAQLYDRLRKGLFLSSMMRITDGAFCSERGEGCAMVLPENRGELYRWVEGFVALEIPLIVKFRQGVIDDYAPVLDKVLDLAPFAIHFNVRQEEPQRPDFDFVRTVKQKYACFLLVSGYVRSVKDVRRLFAAGADMVGIAEPTKQDPGYIHRIANQLGKE